MNVQPIPFTSNPKTISVDNKKNKRIETVSRAQYKTEILTGDFFVGGLTGYSLLNILGTKNILKKIDELPKDDIIKSVSKSFKKNIKWGLLAGAASVVVGHFWFNLTESWQKKLIAKSESYDAESKALMEQVKAQKELNAAIKSGDKVAQKAALEKYNAAVEQEVAIKNARKNGNPEKVQDSEPAEKSETEVNVDEKMTDELQEDK